mmetsp:Transcript_13842/g.20455  ORF Transcript_13842/g.20455 Transcript_13842/m.20455 type:complete len:123 (-) Transcript_13842:595-963(-)
MGNRAGDTKITGATGRIAPDGRWFGNMHIMGIMDLDKFRKEMSKKVADPYSVVLKCKKLPMGLLQDAASLAANGSVASLGADLKLQSSDMAPAYHSFCNPVLSPDSSETLHEFPKLTKRECF